METNHESKMHNIKPFPLEWPKAYPVNHLRKTAPFKCTVATARDHALQQVKLLGGRNIVINSNMTPNTKGLLTGDGYMVDTNPGVVIYFELEGELKFIACDAWKQVRDNLRAIGNTVEDIRRMSRNGCTNIVSQALGNVKMLAPSSGGDNRPWYRVLGVNPNERPDVVKTAYRELVKEYHPDSGNGDVEKFASVQEAWEQYQKIAGK